MSAPLLEVENLSKHYPSRARADKAATLLRAVDGVSFHLNAGETLALVGESGCGKSTTARLALRLIEPTTGHIRFEGQDITQAKGELLRRLRRRMQIVFQDPFSSLNPRMRVSQVLEEPLIIHGVGTRAARRARVEELMQLVGLSPHYARRYPHEFSGGQRQRIGIARALALEPTLVVCDEPVSALDVSIQAQIVNLMKDLQTRLSLSYLFIAHDLAVVKHVADRVAVMYLGQIVELAPKEVLFAQSRHPYTRGLMAAIPRPGIRKTERSIPSGDAPSPIDLPKGCRFHTRCPYVVDICRREVPLLRQCGDEHFTACHRAAELPSLPPLQTLALSPAAEKRLSLYAIARQMSEFPG